MTENALSKLLSCILFLKTEIRRPKGTALGQHLHQRLPSQEGEQLGQAGGGAEEGRAAFCPL